MKKQPNYKQGIIKRSDFIQNADLKIKSDWIQKNLASWTAQKYNSIMQSTAKKYPNELLFQAWTAVIYGDYGQCLSDKKEVEHKKMTVKILKKLLLKAKSMDYRIQAYVRNEIYYHSGDYLAQYKLGIEKLKKGYNGHFSAGVGSAMYASHLYQKGHYKKAEHYAKISIQHWQTFSPLKKLRSNLVFYAIALSIIGKKRQAKVTFKNVLKQDNYANTKHKRLYSKFEKLIVI